MNFSVVFEYYAILSSLKMALFFLSENLSSNNFCFAMSKELLSTAVDYPYKPAQRRYTFNETPQIF